MHGLPRSLVLALLLAMAAVSCRPRPPSPAREMVRQGALLLDVRTPAEFAKRHIEGAMNVPVQELPARMEELGPRDRTIVVYCRTGRRSAAAADLLRGAGYRTVHDLGRMTAW